MASASLMLTTVFIFLAATIAAGWISARARALVAFASILVGIVLIATSGSSPHAALGAAALMAAGSVALGGMYFGPRVRVAFGIVTALPFVFVALAALPLTRVADTAQQGMDLVLLAGAAVIALIALSSGRPKVREDSAADPS